MAIVQALDQAGVQPHEVSYVEAHGTGTALGDPIEVGALKAVYGQYRDEESPLVVGALKTNIGHLEGAAGIAGLIKAVLVLQHQAAPPNLHFSKLNPAIDVEGFPVVFPARGGLTPLQGSGIYAGVSSFGFGGANAHVLLERGTGMGITKKAPELPKVAFLFTGQGSQYVGMGKELYDAEPVYRESFDLCASILKQWLPCSLQDLVFGGEGISSSLVNDTRYSQPALFVLEYCVSELWKSYGVTPGAVMGHSAGEVVAACVAGVMSLEDGLFFIVHRAIAMHEAPTADGCMYALRAGVEEVSATIGDKLVVSIAAVNGPKNVTVSGSETEVQKLLTALDGVAAKRLMVSHAFHSPLMCTALPGVKSAAARVALAVPEITMITNATGMQLPEEQAQSPDHWAELVVKPVLFSKGMATLAEEGFMHFIEVGPKSHLCKMGKQCFSALGTSEQPTFLSLFEGGSDPGMVFHESLGKLERGSIQLESILYMKKRSFACCQPSCLLLQHHAEKVVEGKPVSS
ncbi:unnamed protein product [Chrysoparadoxa australica]